MTRSTPLPPIRWKGRLRTDWRQTTQTLMPASHPGRPGHYDLYPAHPLPPGAVRRGVDALAQVLAAQGARQVVLDGYVGVFWEDLRERLDRAFRTLGRRSAWRDVSQALKPPTAIQSLVMPFLGGDDPLFGTRFTGTLADLFDRERLQGLAPDPQADVTVLYGCGAALAGWSGPLVYVDLPKNELQFRARAGAATNLGCSHPDAPKAMYKRFYFVDWPALNGHKAALVDRVDWLVDGQRPHDPTFLAGDVWRQALDRMAHSWFRARPWFEPGPWGGQWLKRHIPELPAEAPNYAWSFELIAPENGLLVEGDGLLVEFSLDWLMYRNHRAILGRGAARFGTDFPIRFDYLDTVEGGPLSLQCHPRPEYMREHFGEPFTQDETYYILDCVPGAQVYLGFQEEIDPSAFRNALERSLREGVPVEVERFVRTEPAHPGALFRIPSGTVHCSGPGNLVLEISATPYIFTFKMYDWLRRDLDGRPRPLNIQRAFENLVFERQGERAHRELVSRPRTVEKGPDWRIVHLPTHPEHFYDVWRYEFETEIQGETRGSPHVMNLVEGSAVALEMADGTAAVLHFAESVVVSAGAGLYRLRNLGRGTAQVVVAFLK